MTRLSAGRHDPGAKLDGKANQIAAFFRPYPVDEAVAGVRDHIAAFWTPAMRGALRARAAAGGPGLDPLVRTALLDAGAGVDAPGRSETAGPAEAGAVGASDSG